MPLTSPCAIAFFSPAIAGWASHSVGMEITFMLGYFAFMQAVKASERSRPLIEVSAPSNCTTVPLPPSLVPSTMQALVP